MRPSVRSPLVLWLATLVAGVALGALLHRPPPVASADAPATTFSAERAMRVVEALARESRPVGSAAHDRARDFVVSELEQLGFEVEIQRLPWRVDRGSSQRVIRVENVVARLAGSSGERALLLMAHYDSQPQTFGAGDDASGVAVILEAVRARLAAGPLEQDLVVAITDAEEIGLVGARAFVERHRWYRGADLVLNFEARGRRGVAILFETTAGSLDLIDAFGRLAPYPTANSLAWEVYRRMPNDTDFSIVKRAGGRGLNFAFIGGHTAYHSALDHPDLLDRRTVQQEGANALALLTAFDRGELPGVSAANGVYFNPIGIRWLVVWHERSAGRLAWLLLLAGLVVVGIELRAGETTAGRAVLLWGRLLLAIVLAAGASYLIWRLVTLFSGGALPTPHGVPHLEGLTTLGFALVAAAAVALMAGSTPDERPSLAALGLFWSLLSVVVGSVAPGATFLTLVPAMVLTAAAVACRLGPRAGSFGLAAALGILGAFWTPILGLVLSALTVHLAAAVAVLFALALSPLLAVFQGTRRLVWAVGLLLCGGVALTAVVFSAGSAERPRSATLWHLTDSAGKASWDSFDGRVGVGESWADATSPEALGARPILRNGEAPDLGLPSPMATLEADEAVAGGRRLSVRLASPRGAELMRAVLRSDGEITTCDIDGAGCEVAPEGELRLLHVGADETGFLVTLEVAAATVLDVELLDQSWGLPAGAARLPTGTIVTPSWWSHSTMVAASETLAIGAVGADQGSGNDSRLSPQ